MIRFMLPAARHRRAGHPLRRATPLLIAAATATAVLSTVTAGTSSPAAAMTTKVSGAFAKDGPSGQSAFGTWRARTDGLAMAFAPGGNWSDLELPSTWVGYWSTSTFRTKMIISLPMLPKNVSSSLATGATGSYDAHFRTAGQRLVNAGMGNAIIRLGWELNGGWYPWAAKSNPSGYAAYYRHIVNAMRSVPGQSFRFVWSVSNGYYGWDPRTAWPGDSYVSYVGVGVYDAWWRHADATPAQRWNVIVNCTSSTALGGLDFWTQFAASKSKPLGFPEWGLVNKYAAMAGGSYGGGGGDDPYFIQQMYNWVQNHDVAWESYFNSDANDGYHRIDGGRYPNAAASYRQLFGGA